MDQNCNCNNVPSRICMCGLEIIQRAPENGCEIKIKDSKDSQTFTTMAQDCNCNNFLRRIDATTSMCGSEKRGPANWCEMMSKDSKESQGFNTMAEDCNCNNFQSRTTSICGLEKLQRAPENGCAMTSKDVKESQSFTNKDCNCNNFRSWIDATTSMCDLEKPKRSGGSTVPQTESPLNVSFNNLDELMNIWFCETEENARVFMNQVAEVLRRDVLLMECMKKIENLQLLMESTAASVIMCENELEYVDHAQELMESSFLPKLEQYLQDTGEFPSDQRSLLYNQLLSVSSERMALMDSSDLFTAEYDEDGAAALQIVEILSLHQQVLSQIDSKMDAIADAVVNVTASFNTFSERCPCIPCLFPRLAQCDKDDLDITDDVANQLV